MKSTKTFPPRRLFKFWKIFLNRLKRFDFPETTHLNVQSFYFILQIVENRGNEPLAQHKHNVDISIINFLIRFNRKINRKCQVQTEVNQESKQRGNSSKQGAEFVREKKKEKTNTVCSLIAQRNRLPTCQQESRTRIFSNSTTHPSIQRLAYIIRDPVAPEDTTSCRSNVAGIVLSFERMRPTFQILLNFSVPSISNVCCIFPSFLFFF